MSEFEASSLHSASSNQAASDAVGHDDSGNNPPQNADNINATDEGRHQQKTSSSSLNIDSEYDIIFDLEHNENTHEEHALLVGYDDGPHHVTKGTAADIDSWLTSFRPSKHLR